LADWLLAFGMLVFFNKICKISTALSNYNHVQKFQNPVFIIICRNCGFDDFYQNEKSGAAFWNQYFAVEFSV
jgi:predicted nucleic-acid-binding Zn-ribbon protein